MRSQIHFSGVVRLSVVFTFPAGKLAKQTIPATAGDVETDLSPGSGKRWVILPMGRIVLTTDANAANRYIRLRITDGTNDICYLGFSAVAVASKTANLELNSVIRVDDVTPDKGAGDVAASLSFDPIIIEGAMGLKIDIIAGVAGDSYEGFLYVLEMDMD